METGKFNAVIIQGPPGSGKGTQAKLLAEKTGYYHFTSSREAKEYMKSHDDPETLKQKENYAKGLLFDPEWIFKVVKERSREIYEKSGGRGGIIYDGSPRTLYEAENLYEFLTRLAGEEGVSVVIINVGENELKKRVANRLICDNSAFHVFVRAEGLKPGSPCPEGDGVLRERELDDESVFATRMSEFRKRTVPALDYLRKRHGKVVEINGERSVEEVSRDIAEALGAAK